MNIFHDPGYEIPLPWKDGEPQLEDNREQATHRLNSMFRRFEKDPTYKEDYSNAIQKYFEMGVYKRTLKKRKQSGIRFGSGFQSNDLNDALITGPALFNDLPNVLIKFREGAGRDAFRADIECLAE